MPDRNETSIEKLSPSHYFEIIEIWEASVRATHHFLSEEDIAFYKPIVLKYALPAIDLYGIYTNNNLSGFIGILQDKIEMLFLRPECRGQGLGRRLLEYALNELKTYKIDVNEENPEALGFYKHLGCQIISRDKFDGNGKPHPILHLEFPHG